MRKDKKKAKRKREERVKRKEERTKSYSYRSTHRQTDGQIDRHKSFNDMRYNTEQYSKLDSIESNRIESIENKLDKNRKE